MRSFKNHNLLSEFVENLFEYTISTKETGSWAAWGAVKKANSPGWMHKGFDNAGIVISDTTAFQIADGKPDDKNPKIGDPKGAIIAYTNVYNKIDGDLLGKVAWTQNPQSYFKKYEVGSDLVWGSNTDALETAACMGVYLDADEVIVDDNKIGIAAAREKWNPIIKGVLKNGKDWDSGGVSKLLSKIDDMSDVNWRVMILIAKGMRNFINDESKIGKTNLHIIHGSIQKYYTAEEDNLAIATTEDSKDNTADMILANVSAKEVIGVVGSQPIGYNDTDYYCQTSDKKIKYYQISLKKSMDDAQLGKMTLSVKNLYGVEPSSVKQWKSVTDSYMVKHGYEMSELNENWFTDKLSQGLTAIKGFATKWYTKIVGLFNKIKEVGNKLLNGFNREIPNGRPSEYQKSLATRIFNESYKSRHGVFLTEGKVDEKSINQFIKDATPKEAQSLTTTVNDQLGIIEGRFKGNDHLINLNVNGKVSDRDYAKKSNWKEDDLYKLFANSNALDAFIRIYDKNTGDVSKLKDQMIDLEREIYFGKTQLPLFKVYGATTSTDKATTTRLGTAKDFVKDERKKIEGAGFLWPVMGIRYTKSKSGKYYTIEATLLTGANEAANEPTYTACRMGTNTSKRYSFVIEGTHIKDWATFKKVFESDPTIKALIKASS
jgi:hypothetical protein